MPHNHAWLYFMMGSSAAPATALRQIQQQGLKCTPRNGASVGKKKHTASKGFYSKNGPSVLDF
eukprot:2154349-Amphidinium_carterae.1